MLENSPFQVVTKVSLVTAMLLLLVFLLNYGIPGCLSTLVYFLACTRLHT